MLKLNWALACVLLASGSTTVSAQFPTGPAKPPTFSPYLNLLRSGTPTFQNYYGLVRPQIQANQAIQAVQNQLQTATAASAAPGVDATLPVTGQPFGYMTHQSFFLNNRSGGGGTAPAPTGGAANPIRPPPASSNRR